MKTLNVHVTKTKLSAILTEVEKTGEKFVICRNGNPIADIVPHKKRSRVKADPFLSRVKINCDLTEPLTENDWDV